ncbi:MAG: hypothetical protein COA43_15805 [Robiginitomaculum sp.]|nr:MAG: hypothetical protein COA43_15805 [Robiginitomaculum sp.]
MQINKAAILLGELPYLTAYIDNILNKNTREAYIAWLSEQGDTPRASYLSDLSRAFELFEKFFYLNEQGIPRFWAEMVGAPYLFALYQNAGDSPHEDFTNVRNRLFKWVQPAITFEYSMHGEPPAIGSSFFWGTPDLESDMLWPKRKDCLHWNNDDCGLSGDLYCNFIGQINFADFSGTLIAHLLPATGLLSFFSHVETEEWGVVSIKAIFTKNVKNVHRREPPEELRQDADNSPRPAYKIHAREVLSFPETSSSPWADEFPESGYSGRLCDTYESVRGASPSGIVGMLGYHQATTGGDPSPDQDHIRLINIRISPDAGCVHLSISNEDLKAERFDNIKYVWIDWDG